MNTSTFCFLLSLSVSIYSFYKGDQPTMVLGNVLITIALGFTALLSRR